MGDQTDISPKMRIILVDWIIDVHHKEKMHPSTLWLSVNLMDRYLAAVPNINRNRLQLIGVACLLIAAKFEEIYPPEISEFISLTENSFTHNEVIRMEASVLASLQYQLVVPTGYHFLVRYFEMFKVNSVTKSLASYYAERNLQEYDCLSYVPHEFAAACLYAALVQQNPTATESERAVWNTTLYEDCGIAEEKLMTIARGVLGHMEEVHRTSKRVLLAARKKYSQDTYSRVTELAIPQL
jgi:hypothetical protein